MLIGICTRMFKSVVGHSKYIYVLDYEGSWLVAVKGAQRKGECASLAAQPKGGLA